MHNKLKKLSNYQNILKYTYDFLSKISGSWTAAAVMRFLKRRISPAGLMVPEVFIENVGPNNIMYSPWAVTKPTKNRFIILSFFIFLSDSSRIIATQKSIENQDDINQHHVICSYEFYPKTQKELNACNQKVHEATYEIKRYFKDKAQALNHHNSDNSNNQTNEYKIVKNPVYARHSDSVFFIHFDHQFGHWTLYKPSFVSYEDFAEQAKKIYLKNGISVHFDKESTISILQSDAGFDGTTITLQELELYKKMSDADFDLQEKKEQDLLQSKAVSEKTEKKSWFWQHDDAAKKNDSLQAHKTAKAKKMKKFLFWHLQIPTTGLLPSDDFDIDDRFKPLAWNFLLWDLAPKKGQGAKVAIIDTGVSAFNIEKEDRYKKHINSFASSDLQSYGYNLVSENGLDPIRQIAINFGHYCNHDTFDSNELMRQLPEWIKTAVDSGVYSQIESYLTKNVKNEYLVDGKCALNEKGEAALKDLLYGKSGIAPKETEKFFSVINLKSPYNQKALLETLPAPQIIGHDDPLAAGHGTFTHGIVNAKNENNQGLTGFAPNATVCMIKAFHDSGTTNKTTLNGSLQRALACGNTIVSMSLKITDSIDDQKDAMLKKLIDSIDYVVAASGNDGEKAELAHKEAYPAKFSSVAFDVGAFKYDDGNYSVCSFTQKETNVGPKFMAPGFDILSLGLPSHTIQDSTFVFMAGTSVAVPIVTGFLALAVAEFQDLFLREQILKVIYKFSIKLSSHDDWKNDTILGTIDMRSSLLCLHVLATIRIMLQSRPELKFSFETNFDNLVQTMYEINYYVPSCRAQELGYSLMTDFAHYNKAAHKIKNVKNINFFSPSKKEPGLVRLKNTVDFMSNLVISILDGNQDESLKNKKDKNIIDPEFMKKLSNILSTEKFHVFDDLPVAFKNRIDAVLAPKEKCNLPME